MVKEKLFYFSGMINIPPIIAKKRPDWFWPLMQFVGQGVYLAIVVLFHIKTGWISLVGWGIMFTLLYFQVRSSKQTGIEIVVRNTFVNKWTIVWIGAVRCRGIVYKILIAPERAMIVKLFLFTHSKWPWVNRLKILKIKLLVKARLIN